MNEPLTLLDAVASALMRAGDFNKNDQTPPAAILWPDKERQWEPLLPALRLRLPLLTLGGYDPAERTGPAIYLRCMIAGTLGDDAAGRRSVPILYLPGVSRQELRAVEECPKPLQPLAELQYRGVIFSHKNGRDWTIAGFLQAPDGLGIAVGADAATREAMQRALLKLAYEPVAHLRSEAPSARAVLRCAAEPGRRRRLLEWMNDPQGYPAQASRRKSGKRSAPYAAASTAFDPAGGRAADGAEKLGTRYGAWAIVWEPLREGARRPIPTCPAFCARRSLSSLACLARPSPPGPATTSSRRTRCGRSCWRCTTRRPMAARQSMLDLEQQHGQRRSWVWARLGQAPLAVALQHLAALAKAARQPLGGATVEAVAGAYAAWGWQADAAVLDALAAVEKADDVAAVKAAILPLYRPWLEGAARGAASGRPSAP